MKGKCSLLWSEYIIDGIPMDVRPAEMLGSAISSDSAGAKEFDPIVDESLDVPFSEQTQFLKSELSDNLSLTRSVSKRGHIDPTYAAPHTRACVAYALINTLWLRGHFRLSDLALSIKWTWNFSKIGYAAAFYRSVEAACEYMDTIGVRLASYSVKEGADCMVEIRAGLFDEDVIGVSGSKGDGNTEENLLMTEESYRSHTPNLIPMRKCPQNFGKNRGSWIIYVPFDTCSCSLGGSLLAELRGIKAGQAPQISDPDYFMDCFELARELVEDGVALSGVTVCDGGLITALSKSITAKVSLRADLSGVMRHHGTCDLISVLFSEIPGIVVEVRDSDYDYVDAEFLLQDVAYFPLGQLEPGKGEIKVSSSDSLSAILQALLNGQASEGED